MLRSPNQVLQVIFFCCVRGTFYHHSRVEKNAWMCWQLSEKKRYWVEKLAADGIRRPAAIYCSICNRKGHSSYSCWRRDGRGTGWDSSLKKRIQNRLKSESNELPKQCIYCGNPIDVCICKDSEISNITVENDDYIGNWRKDNMPDFF